LLNSSGISSAGPTIKPKKRTIKISSYGHKKIIQGCTKSKLRVFESRMLRKIFGSKREEDGSWRNLHNDELHSLYASPNIVRAIKSRRMRWAGQVAPMGEGRGVYRVFVGRPEGKNH
jgi:hypothetical protein